MTDAKDQAPAAEAPKAPTFAETIAAAARIEGAVDRQEMDGIATVVVPPASFAAAAKAMCDQGFTRFLDLSVVDHVESGREDRFEVFLLVYSMNKKAYARLKSFTTGSLPTTTTTYWGATNYEREAFDLYGVTFVGHPSLTRILMPEGWVGHPMRRDYDMPFEPVDFTVTRDLYNT